LLNFVRKRGFEDPLADLRPAGSERGYIVRIELLKALVDPPIQAIGGKKLPKGLRGGGEAARNADSGRGQAADHLAERGVLAADLLEVGHA
jgi:hypothetical protein